MPSQPPDYVHVFSRIAKNNRKTGTNDPAVIVRRGRSGKSTRAHTVEILDATGKVAAVVEQRPDVPLACGAVIYVRAPYGTRVKKSDNQLKTGVSCVSKQKTVPRPKP